MMRCGRLAALAVLCLAVPAAAAAQDEDGVAVGSAAPRVVVHDLDGRGVDLGRYVGVRPVFLEFWATWCELCAQLMPTVEAAHARYGSQVEFIGVNVSVNQSPARVRRYLAEHKPPFRTLYDDQGISTRAYRVPTTSYVVIIDRSGRVAYTGSGGDQQFDGVLRKVAAP
ncbi:MAG TPA: TlpA disulfide reductase family protein [Gemmatimonadales bacterium]|jgi:thiol-disulfide isomerase/thioredoxin|nr:TlpA disulfide reductase family protein [Gemmatimonadales bacterium]